MDKQEQIKLSYDLADNKIDWLRGNISGKMEPVPAIVGSGKLPVCQFFDYQKEILKEINHAIH